MLSYHPAEILLSAASFSSIALLIRASRHNCNISGQTELWVTHSKPRDQESGINQLQMTWLASHDKCSQEGGKKKKKKSGLTFEKSEVRSGNRLVQAGPDLKAKIKATSHTLRVSRSSSITRFSYICHYVPILPDSSIFLSLKRSHSAEQGKT